MPRSPLSSLAVAVLAASSLFAQGAGTAPKAKLTLRFAPAVGTVSHCILQAEAIGKHEQMGTMEAKLSLHCERTVVSAKDGRVTLRYRFLRVVGSQVETRPDGAKQDEAYDSAKDKGQPPRKFPDVVDDTMVCTIDDRGRIVEVEAPDGMTPASYGPFALNGDPASFLRLFAFELPEAAVAVGDDWSSTWTVGNGEREAFEFASASKLVAVAGGKAAVADTAKCDAPPEVGPSASIDAFIVKASASVDVLDGSVVTLTREMNLEGSDGRGNRNGKVAMTMRWTLQPADAPSAKPKDGEKKESSETTKDADKPKDGAPGGGR